MIVSQQLLGVFRQAIAAITEGRIVIMVADTRVEADAFNDLTGIQPKALCVAVQLVKIGNTHRQIGVSKEFNVFELQAALAKKDLAKAIRIVQYFEANPKAAPIQLVLPSLYSFFSKVIMVFGAGSREEKAVATALGVNPFFVKDYLHAANLYGYEGAERVLLLLHQYNLKSIGIHSADTEDASLLKEMIAKMMAA